MPIHPLVLLDSRLRGNDEQYGMRRRPREGGDPGLMPIRSLVLLDSRCRGNDEFFVAIYQRAE